jgi:hypothetical protein
LLSWAPAQRSRVELNGAVSNGQKS